MSERYAKQIILPEIGPAGQKRLAAGRALCVGAGGLGCAVLPYLAGAGVGHITVIDNDRVDRSNLQRQVLFGESSLGRPKVEAAAERLTDLNPDIEVRGLNARLDLDNIEALLTEHDVIIDGSDNYATKYLVADACVKFDRPLVYGSVTGMEALVTVFHAGHGPCLRCLFPEAPTGWVPNCAEAGVLGSLVGMTGSLQASEAIKLLLGCNGELESLCGRLWAMDARDGHSRLMAVRRRPDCAVCSGSVDNIVLHGATAPALREIDVAEAATLTDWTFLDVREPDEFAAGHISGAVNLPLSDLQSGHTPPNLSRCVLYCESGARCRTAAEILRRYDYQDIRGLRGGYPAWQASTRGLHSTQDKELFMSNDIPYTFGRFTDRFPEVAAAHSQMGGSLDSAGPLDEKTRALVKIGICAGARLESALKSHVRRARQHGVSAEEIEHAIVLGTNTVGFPSTVAAWQWASKALADSDKG